VRELQERLRNRGDAPRPTKAPAAYKGNERAAIRLMRMLLTSTPDIIMILDRNGRLVTGSNRLLTAAQADSFDQIHGMYVRDLYLRFGDEEFAGNGEKTCANRTPLMQSAILTASHQVFEKAL
jgi:hypothetical protein